MDPVTLLILIILVVWLVGAIGPGLNDSIPNSGGVVHLLLVIVVILIILRLLRLL